MDPAALREFRFEFTLEDYVRFNLDHEARTRAVKHGLITLAGTLTLGVVLPLAVDAVQSWDPERSTFGYVIWGVFLATFWFFLLRSRWDAVRKTTEAVVRNPDGGARLLGARRMIFGERGVRQEQDSQVLDLEWTAFTRVVRGPDHLQLYFSPVHALVLPRRCFGSPDDFEIFAAKIEARIAGARPSR